MKFLAVYLVMLILSILSIFAANAVYWNLEIVNASLVFFGLVNFVLFASFFTLSDDPDDLTDTIKALVKGVLKNKTLYKVSSVKGEHVEYKAKTVLKHTTCDSQAWVTYIKPKGSRLFKRWEEIDYCLVSGEKFSPDDLSSIDQRISRSVRMKDNEATRKRDKEESRRSSMSFKKSHLDIYENPIDLSKEKVSSRGNVTYILEEKDSDVM